MSTSLIGWELGELLKEVEAEVVIAHERGDIPKLHPHGFIQVELEGRGRRLHVWDTDIPRTADPETMHDHVWNFKSTVLAGTLINHTFTLQFEKNGKPEDFYDYQLWECQPDRQEGARGGKKLAKAPMVAKIVNHLTTEAGAGETYAFSAFEFHDSEAVGYTATLFEKTLTFDAYDPQVLCKIGGNPDDELPMIRLGQEVDPSEITPEWLWSKVFELFS